MNRIQVLDCTLRDGGYCNQWQFGFANIKTIAKSLIEADIDVVECGFITNRIEYNKNVTRFTALDELMQVLPVVRNGKLFVAMMNYGEFSIDELPDYNGASINGIRVAFHKTDRIKALELCEKIKKKGYLVFVQAMVSLSYTDEEFLDLIKRVNEFEPYAFYIVDSFGMMKGKDLIRLFYMVEHNLKESIKIGFHSHNNLQLAFSNAQQLVGLNTNRDLVIDSSVYGMGRGAGNLNTELFVEYLNENAGTHYEIKPLLTIIDEIINEFYQRNPWGYSLPNYLSASHNTHPNYAEYLDDKKTLTIDAMNDIFDLIDNNKRFKYDKEYIEELYIKYMGRNATQKKREMELKKRLSGKIVVVVAPGKSSIYEQEKIRQFINDNKAICIVINHDCKCVHTDFIFLSNLRRYRELDVACYKRCIVTSNIPSNDIYLQTRYSDLLNDVEAVRDNAGLMTIKFLMEYNIKAVYLAGFDGYSHDIKENYGENELAFVTRNAVLDAMNAGMTEVLKAYKTKIELSFLTKPRNVLL